ncbi:unnamed protein product [Cercopithifilaria johnstoni]|uniref:Uncharacterized protein n=1 Tax=Cercopithifilaria johnstoni TaxID=2874296 RepID=A0A8J2PWF5_9BILA|nr:unnamed protein product [Cercopithifilaria johnstoni]
MVLSIREATTEVAIIVNDEGLQQSAIKYIMKSYACAIVGTLLALVSIPVFIIVVNDKALRLFDLSYKDIMKMSTEHSTGEQFLQKNLRE